MAMSQPSQAVNITSQLAKLKQVDIADLGISPKDILSLSNGSQEMLGKMLSVLDKALDDSVTSGALTKPQVTALMPDVVKPMVPAILKGTQALNSLKPVLPPVSRGFRGLASGMMNKNQFGQLSQLAANGSAPAGALLATMAGVQALKGIV